MMMLFALVVGDAGVDFRVDFNGNGDVVVDGGVDVGAF